MRIKCLFTAVCAAVALTLASCGGQSELAGKVDELNGLCPMELELTGETITQFSLEDGNLVVESLISEEDLAFVENLVDNYPDLVKQNTIIIFQNAGELRELYGLLVEEEAGIEVRYTGAVSGKTIITTTTAEEVQASYSGLPDDDPQRIIDGEVQMTNATLPLQIEEGLTLTQLVIEGDFVVHCVTVDEEVINFDELEKLKDDLHDTLAEWLASDDEGMEDFLNIYRNAKKGIAYRYTGGTSGKTFMIKIPYYEI